MSLEEELTKIRPHKDTLLSIGVFDGVHLGHEHLISHLSESARKRDMLIGVLTFNRHPEEILSPPGKLCYLITLEQRRQLLQSLHPDFVVVLPFTRETAETTAREFIVLLQKHLRMRGLVIGPNFTLGNNKAGNAATLQKMGQEMGFTIDVVPPLEIKGIMVSSTTIRLALHDGNIKRVNMLLGRPFSLEGKIIPGVGQSTIIGFPTANLDVASQQCLPANGVYATLIQINNKRYFSLTNIGGKATLGRVISQASMEFKNVQFVETHILDFTGNLNGVNVKIQFLEHLREELVFDNINDIRSQINDDIKQAKAIFENLPEYGQETK